MTTRWSGEPPTYVGRHRGRTSFGELLTPRRFVGRHRATFCSWCDGPVLTPVRDAEYVSWVGLDGASTWCSTDCMQIDAEHRSNADGNR